jgi:hypothetical protein
MKAEKKLRHDVLMQEVLNESKARFIASITLIKKCIANLNESGNDGFFCRWKGRTIAK